MSKSILLTRPIEQSKRFENAFENGVKNSIIIAPMVNKSEKNIRKDYKEIKAFIVSSTNAIEAIKSNIKILSHLSKNKIPIYCVGKHTAAVGGKATGLGDCFLWSQG